jgi:hypothetical protein
MSDIPNVPIIWGDLGAWPNNKNVNSELKTICGPDMNDFCTKVIDKSGALPNHSGNQILYDPRPYGSASCNKYAVVHKPGINPFSLRGNTKDGSIKDSDRIMMYEYDADWTPNLSGEITENAGRRSLCSLQISDGKMVDSCLNDAPGGLANWMGLPINVYQNEPERHSGDTYDLIPQWIVGPYYDPIMVSGKEYLDNGFVIDSCECSYGTYEMIKSDYGQSFNDIGDTILYTPVGAGVAGGAVALGGAALMGLTLFTPLVWAGLLTAAIMGAFMANEKFNYQDLALIGYDIPSETWSGDGDCITWKNEMPICVEWSDGHTYGDYFTEKAKLSGIEDYDYEKFQEENLSEGAYCVKWGHNECSNYIEKWAKSCKWCKESTLILSKDLYPKHCRENRDCFGNRMNCKWDNCTLGKCSQRNSEYACKQCTTCNWEYYGPSHCGDKDKTQCNQSSSCNWSNNCDYDCKIGEYGDGIDCDRNCSGNKLCLLQCEIEIKSCNVCLSKAHADNIDGFNHESCRPNEWSRTNTGTCTEEPITKSWCIPHNDENTCIADERCEWNSGLSQCEVNCGKLDINNFQHAAGCAASSKCEIMKGIDKDMCVSNQTRCEFPETVIGLDAYRWKPDNTGDCRICDSDFWKQIPGGWQAVVDPDDPLHELAKNAYIPKEQVVDSTKSGCLQGLTEQSGNKSTFCGAGTNSEGDTTACNNLCNDACGKMDWDTVIPNDEDTIWNEKIGSNTVNMPTESCNEASKNLFGVDAEGMDLFENGNTSSRILCQKNPILTLAGTSDEQNYLFAKSWLQSELRDPKGHVPKDMTILEKKDIEALRCCLGLSPDYITKEYKESCDLAIEQVTEYCDDNMYPKDPTSQSCKFAKDKKEKDCVTTTRWDCPAGSVCSSSKFCKELFAKAMSNDLSAPFSLHDFGEPYPVDYSLDGSTTTSEKEMTNISNYVKTYCEMMSGGSDPGNPSKCGYDKDANINCRKLMYNYCTEPIEIPINPEYLVPTEEKPIVYSQETYSMPIRIFTEQCQQWCKDDGMTKTSGLGNALPNQYGVCDMMMSSSCQRLQADGWFNKDLINSDTIDLADNNFLDAFTVNGEIISMEGQKYTLSSDSAIKDSCGCFLMGSQCGVDSGSNCSYFYCGAGTVDSRGPNPVQIFYSSNDPTMDAFTN